MRRYTQFVMITIAVTLLAAACAGAATPTGGGTSLQGTEWQLVSLNGSTVIEGSTVTLVFEEETASGSAGCNSYGGSYTTGSDNGIGFTELFQTEMACMEQGIMEQESAYLQTLAAAASFQATDDRLEIMDASGTTVLVFVRHP